MLAIRTLGTCHSYIYVLENTIHLIVGLARAEKALFTVTRTSLGPFLHIDPLYVVIESKKKIHTTQLTQ